MYILKNAMKNLVRNKGRNILIGIIVLTMISTIAISTIINTTTNEVIKSYENRFGSEVFIDIDPVKAQKEIEKNQNKIPFAGEITGKMKVDFADSKLVKEYKMEASFQGVSEEIKGIGEEEFNKRQNERQNNRPLKGATSDGAVSSNYVWPSLAIKGYTENNLSKDFKNGSIQIKSGEMFKGNNEAIISQQLADLNTLKVGDEFEITDTNDKDKKLKLKVTGIYSRLNQKDEMMPIPSMDLRNEIYTNFNTLAEFDTLFKGENAPIQINATYYLNSPDDLEAFKSELKSKGLTDNFIVSTDEESYNRIVAPVNGLKKVSVMFMIGIMGFGSIVLILLSVLSIRERKYEIGVLRAMGMSKFKLATGFVCESVVIIMICLTLGLGIGAISAQPAADVLLKEQIESKVEQQNLRPLYTQSGEIKEVEKLEELEVKLSPEAVLKISGFAIILGLITSSISVGYATKYEPIKILSERN
ncbi:ABC transporter permease [Clostridium sardiniense]|uniref:ABC transporter permease n=1 Tax=Clostridium sardiniense TaxID=29369 RepID=UPI003D333A0F